jgi:hypothetical protein
MNTKSVDAIANAVLYEGYMLYPYRASSVKNRQRFNFGVLYPKAYSEMQSGSDAWKTQTECLVEGSSQSAIEIKVRFLKLVERVTEAKESEAVPPWREAIECEVAVPICSLGALVSTALSWPFSFPAQRDVEVLRGTSHDVTGQIIRSQAFLEGRVQITAEPVAPGLFKVRVVVQNLTAFDSREGPREPALMQSLVSAHTLLGLADGQFVSLLEPPDNLKDLAARCQNLGAWPVLVGGEGERDTMLSSPIILYDYPQIAPESPGDLFDGTEIDEILALRILTMTDDEKNEMRNTDERARRMLERTENLPMEHLMQLHGTLRELRSLQEEKP